MIYDIFRTTRFLRLPEAGSPSGVAGDGGGAASVPAAGAGGLPASGGVGAGAGGAGGSASAPGASSAPVTDFRTFIDEKGNITKADGFFDKDTAHLAKRFTSVGSLAKSYVNLERMQSSSNKVALPGENSAPEEWNSFYERLGRPAKPEDYKIERPESLKDLPVDDSGLAEFRTLAHQQGFTAKQVEALTKWHFSSTEKQLGQMKESTEATRTAAVESLKGEWGTKYESQLALAKKAAGVLGGEELIANQVLANDPVFIKALAKAGAMMSEQALAGGRQGMVPPANPREEINRIMADKSDPYWKATHPQHGARVEHIKRLFELANPEPQ